MYCTHSTLRSFRLQVPLYYLQKFVVKIYLYPIYAPPSLSPSLFERTSLRPYLVASVPSTGVLNVCKAIKNWTVGRLGNEATQHTPNGKKVTLINQLDTQCCTCRILASHYLDTCGLVPFPFMLFRSRVHPYTIKLS